MSGDSAIKLALKARAARQQAAAALAADPIAIVGIGCRFPGGVRRPADYWRLLSEGRDAVRKAPADRWDADALYDADMSAPGRSVTREGGFIDDIDRFDADYFDILGREAEQMDPQQRLFLEVASEAIDDAGLTQEGLAGSRTGVYVASYHNDYAGLVYGDRDALDLRSLTGTLHSVLANRLSWHLDLRGPSLSIDTACSSSLVAIHLACQSLRSGETDLALAGGVSLMITPDMMVSMSKVGFMSPDGRCKTFDSSADGFGRGEGCGVAVFKRLADALADRDRVLAVIRSSCVNQDGRSTVLTAPSGPAQVALLREALGLAQIDAARVGFVETHGTGTALGDPIEVEAIVAALGGSGEATGPCYLGSAKANIGHLEAAAGIAGLIKTVLALRHGAVPPQVHYREINPHIDLRGTRFAVPTALTPWPAGPLPRVATVSGFGVGGTNAHVIVEEAPQLPDESSEETDGSAWRLLPLSARSADALADLESAWRADLTTSQETFGDLCFTAGEHRTHYSFRRAFVARSSADLGKRLAASLAEAAPSVAAPAHPRIGFVFCGQGPQWFGMGRQLVEAEPVFRDKMEACDALLRRLAGWSLLEELSAGEDASRLSKTEIAQPALFSLQVSVAALLESWGISLAAVVGHSIGEVAALHAAGVLDLDEAMRIVWLRGHAMRGAAGKGRMATTSLAEADALDFIRRHPGLDVAAVNGPRSVVLAGAPDRLDAALAELDARKVASRRLPVDYAFHSAQMDLPRSAFETALGEPKTRPAKTAFYSTVTGARLKEDDIGRSYFGRNVREPVRFASAVRSLLNDGCDVLIEIGPHPVLAASLAEISGEFETPPRLVTTLRRGRDERENMLGAVAAAYEAGCNPDWSRLSPRGRIVSLPSYPWRREHYWLRRRTGSAAASSPKRVHHILGDRLPLATGDIVYDGSSATIGDWIADHRLFDRVLLPGAAVLEAFAKAAEIDRATDVELSDFGMERSIAIDESGAAVRWQIVGRREGGERRFEMFVATGDEGGDGWTRVAAAAMAAAAGPRRSIEAPAEREPVSQREVYDDFRAQGVDFGPKFRLLHDVERGRDWARARIAAPASGTEGFILHPSILDAALQLCSVAAGARQIYVPTGAAHAALRKAASAPLVATARARLDGDRILADVVVDTESGLRVADLSQITFRRVDADNLLRRAVPATRAGSDSSDTLLYETAWAAADAGDADPVACRGAWLVFADAGGVAEGFAARLTAAGGEVWTVCPGSSFETAGAKSCRLDPASAADMRRLMDAKPWGGAPLRGVVHFWSLDDGDDAARDAAEGRTLGSLLHLAQALADALAPLAIVTRGAQIGPDGGNPDTASACGAAAWGLAGVIRAEHPEFGVRIVDLDPVAANGQELFDEILTRSDPRTMLRGGRRFIPRLRNMSLATPSATTPAERMRLTVVQPGDLSGLGMAAFDPRPPGPGEVLLKVVSAGLNYRDVLSVLGMYPGEIPPLGAECAGVVEDVGPGVQLAAGDRVFGYVPGGLATEATVPAAFLARVPPDVDFDSAAGLAVAFLTAIYGLETLAQCKAGDRVLIHAATGGVGMAAVQVARRLGCEIFATAGSPHKRALLRAAGLSHVFDSRSETFAEEILAATGGCGVDVVLNSLAGPFVAAGFRCLAAGGRFLELGKRDIFSPEEAHALRPDVDYRVYDLGAEAERNHELLPPLLAQLTSRLAEGTLDRLPVTRFDFKDATSAMRLMARSRHAGKIVLRVATEASARGFAPTGAATYWITGGLGGLGLKTAEWLCESGARHIVLSGRRQPSAAAQARISVIRERGANILCLQSDVSLEADVARVLATIARDMPPLRGIVHAAGALRDGVLARQTIGDARAVMSGKAGGAALLDRLTRHLPLDVFILYSAAATVLGGGGQGFYPAANAQLDQLARQRRLQGLPATSVAWGLWSGVGMAAASNDSWRARGLKPLPEAAAFDALRRLVDAGTPQAIVMAIDWPRFLRQPTALVDADFYREAAPAVPIPARNAAVQARRIVDVLRDALPGQRRERLGEFLRRKTVEIVGHDEAATAPGSTPLKEIGVDSLMAVELRNHLARAGGQPLPATLLFDHPTFDALVDVLMRQWGLQEKPPLREVAAPTAVADLESLSDAEAEDMLMRELGLAAKGDMA